MSASRVFVSPDAYRDIKKMKLLFKRKKSDIESIKRSWPFPKVRRIKPLNVELRLIDIDFTASIKQVQADLYRMLVVPKEYL